MGRHAAASLLLEVVSEQLGHSTTVITQNLDQHVPRAVHDGAAEAVTGVMWTPEIPLSSGYKSAAVAAERVEFGAGAPGIFDLGDGVLIRSTVSAGIGLPSSHLGSVGR